MGAFCVGLTLSIAKVNMICIRRRPYCTCECQDSVWKVCSDYTHTLTLNVSEQSVGSRDNLHPTSVMTTRVREMYALSGEALFQEVLALSSSYLEMIWPSSQNVCKIHRLYFAFLSWREPTEKKKPLEGHWKGRTFCQIQNKPIRCLHCQFSQLGTVWNFLLLRGAALDPHRFASVTSMPNSV